MLPRFFVPGPHATESVIELPDDEAAHLTRVLRLSAGEAVRVFDGRGQEWHAVLDQVSKQRVTVRLDHTVVPLAEPGVAITLALAVLKGNKMDDVVRDVVMLGASTIQPLISERTEVAARVVQRGGRTDRWQRIAVASAKQCGRAVVPPVKDALGVDEALSGTRAISTVMFVEPHAGAAVQSVRDVPRSPELMLLVGPEGGWTAREVQHATAAGAMLVTLGTQILRADAAPLVALTAVRVALGDM